MSRRLGLLSAPLLLTLAAPSPALAQQQDAEGHYQSAVRLLGEGRYRESLQEFDAAIAITPNPIFYCNRAVALIQLKELDAALDSLQTCRDTFEGDDQALAQIDAQLKALSLLVREVRPNATKNAITIATLPRATNTPAKGGWSAADTGYIGLGIGAALLGSAATLDLLSADLVTDFKDASTGTDRARYDAARADLAQRQRIFWGLTIGGSVLAATGAGLILYHFLSDDGEEATSATVLPMITPGGAGVVLDWRF